MEPKISRTVLLTGVVLGVSLIAGTLIVSQTMFKVRTLNDTLSVTGSAKQKVTSDQVKWRASFSRTVAQTDIKAGYAKMKDDEKLVTAFLKDNQMGESDFVISPVTMNEVYKQYDGTPKESLLSQSVVITSGDVAKITSLSKNIQKLIDQGVMFSTQGLEYYYTKLPDTRVSLLTDAVQDARTRAEKIATSSGMQVGAIQSASTGAVQVVPVNSVDVSDYGNYDTTTIDKEVMVTVRAVFRLK